MIHDAATKNKQVQKGTYCRKTNGTTNEVNDARYCDEIRRACADILFPRDFSASFFFFKGGCALGDYKE